MEADWFVLEVSSLATFSQCPEGVPMPLQGEELKFALANGYELNKIGEAYAFQRGENTFKALIEQLNEMKRQAQLNGQPTIRNISKLLMNSMYGRFGMHTDNIRQVIVDATKLPQLSRDFSIKDSIDLGACPC
jgi:hypothetical protein